MRFSKLFVHTLKETPKEAEVISHKLLLRAGMIKKLASGIYSYMPLGYRVLRKIEGIVREELDKAGAQEILMPVLQPAELWQESGRWDKMGDEMMRMTDRHNRNFVLGPTHEEVVTDIVRREVKSYKELPINLYQIQLKYRDERRPRFGLMRGREFFMKDGYSFHTDEDSLEKEYQNMHEAYNNIFSRCGLTFRAVEADSGNIGGDTTHEIMVLADSGEDEVLYCDKCEYAANIEKAESKFVAKENSEELKELEKVETPNKKSIEEVAEFLGVEKINTVKAMIFKTEEEFYMVLIRGDYEVNEVKLKNLLKVSEVTLANDAEIEKLNLHKGFLGPVGVKLKIIADETIKNMKNYVTGGNDIDNHYINTNHNKDYSVETFADIRIVKLGEKCPRCSDGVLNSARGIEVGQIFKLGTKYSEALKCNFINENGRQQPMLMGCYGIGVSRTMAAAVEQNYDESGIIWPISIAPYIVDVIPVNMKDKEQVEVAEKLYNNLKENGIEVAIDDRKERAGFKFKDADLIGFPVKVIVGKGIATGKVEVVNRKTGEKEDIEIEELLNYINKLIK
ncbi:proline--tRNA ligase [Haliovirga abyssi]|uniref:Proline--tRNA ligase n=1 Tax=Haliovirga abyssi TaxID=2996794 RepID=A0AAU9D7Q9_9FUSO|nr:proline--tRNA ligase [Haliovirga abyssi]BDU50598.1 proline--tRNA ligase [Haliovirga abyssi]